MSALADALVAAQRRSLATLEKAYVAGAIEAEPMVEALDERRPASPDLRPCLAVDRRPESRERDAREARDGLRGSESPREGTEA